MNSKFKTISRYFSISAWLFTAAGVLLHLTGLHFNPSKSVAVGFYWQSRDPVEWALQKGAYVLVCPPDTPVFNEFKARGYFRKGFCSGGISGLLKKVAAVRGDRVSITSEGVRVNGQMLPLSKPNTQDVTGKPLPQPTLHQRSLDEHELLLMGDINPNSFDARYFGLVDRAQVQAVVRPVWTW